MSEGKRLYDIYCGICHGETGDGKGFLTKNEKYGGVPISYLDEAGLAMPAGQMFHATQHGKGGMGSYAYAMSKEQRWQVILYITDGLQADFLASQPEDAGDDAGSDEEPTDGATEQDTEEENESEEDENTPG